MLAFGIPNKFLTIAKILVVDAQASVKVNGSQSPNFQIKRRVRQGCPLAPYLLLIIAEVLNVLMKEGLSLVLIKGIRLLVGDKQQIIAQFANDTSLTLLGEEAPICQAISALERLCQASSPILNWTKSCGY